MSHRIRLALGGAGILVLALVVFFMLINPIRGEIGDLRLKIGEENQKIQAAQIQLAQAEDTRSQGRQNQARLLELAKMIPKSAEVPSLILQLQDLAEKAGIEFTTISPSPGRAAEGAAYQTVTLSLAFSGSFYDVSDFVYRAEQMVSGPGRLLTVKDVALSPETVKGTSVLLGVRITLYAYYMPDAAAESQAPSSSPAPDTGNTVTTVNAQ